MKILAFIDVHSNNAALRRLLKKAQGVDVLVCAGDISDWGKDTRKMLSFFKDVNKPFLVIHGNHELEINMKKICSELKFPTFMHKKVFELDGYTFIGFGGGGFAFEDKEFELFVRNLKLKAGSKVVLFTHAPPYGTKCDYLTTVGFVGCRSFNKAIRELKPLVHICGHIHENASCKDKIGSTVVVNPGADGKIIRI